MIDDRLQERAVVADHEHGGVEAPQVVLEPGGGLEVEVIGGLVQQQHVGRRHQLLRQAQAPALPAAQPREVPRPGVVRIEAQAVEYGVDPRGQRVASLAIEPLQVAVVAGEHLRGAAVAGLSQLGGLLAERALEREQLAEGAGGRLPHRGGAGELPVLLHDRVAQTASPRHRPRAGLGLAGDDAEQSGLP